MERNDLLGNIDVEIEDFVSACQDASNECPGVPVDFPRALVGYGPLEWARGKLPKDGTLWTTALKENVPLHLPFAIIVDVFSLGVVLSLLSVFLSPIAIMAAAIAVCVVRGPLAGIPAWLVGTALSSSGLVSPSDTLIIIACMVPLLMSAPILMDVTPTSSEVVEPSRERSSQSGVFEISIFIAPAVFLLSVYASRTGDAVMRISAFLLFCIGIMSILMLYVPEEGHETLSKREIAEQERMKSIAFLVVLTECGIGFLCGAFCRNAGSNCGIGLAITLPLLCWSTIRAVLFQTRYGSFMRADAFLSSMMVLAGSGAYRSLTVYGSLLATVTGLIAGFVIIGMSFKSRHENFEGLWFALGCAFIVVPIVASFDTLAVIAGEIITEFQSINIYTLGTIVVAGTAGHLAWRLVGRRLCCKKIMRVAGRKERRETMKAIGRKKYIEIVSIKIPRVAINAIDWSRPLGRLIGGIVAGGIVFGLGYGYACVFAVIVATLVPEFDCPYANIKGRRYRKTLKKRYAERRSMSH